MLHGVCAASMADTAVEIGLGLVRIQLEAEWTYTPHPPFSGVLTSPEGYRFTATVNSLNDSAAASGGERILDYLDDEFTQADAPTPEQAVNSVHCFAREPRPDEHGWIVWKSLEPHAGSHVREFELECRMDQRFFTEESERVFQRGSDIMTALAFNPDFAPLDRVAPSDAEQRINVEENVYLLVPADWTPGWETFEDGEQMFVVDAPDDGGTLWLSRQILVAEGETIDPPRFSNVFEELATGTAKDPKAPFEHGAVEYLNPLDALATMTRRNEPDPSGPLRRIFWIRMTATGSHCCQLFAHLVISEQKLANPVFLDPAGMVAKQLRQALVLPAL